MKEGSDGGRGGVKRGAGVGVMRGGGEELRVGGGGAGEGVREWMVGGEVVCYGWEKEKTYTRRSRGEGGWGAVYSLL